MTRPLTLEDKQILAEFTQRRITFDNFINLKLTHIKLFTCPSCGFPSIPERANYDLCEICNWEDDGQDDPNADEVWHGPNSNRSLTDSRLKTGKDLNSLQGLLTGTIITDPKAFFAILEENEKNLRNPTSVTSVTLFWTDK